MCLAVCVLSNRSFQRYLLEFYIFCQGLLQSPNVFQCIPVPFKFIQLIFLTLIVLSPHFKVSEVQLMYNYIYLIYSQKEVNDESNMYM